MKRFTLEYLKSARVAGYTFDSANHGANQRWEMDSFTFERMQANGAADDYSNIHTFMRGDMARSPPEDNARDFYCHSLTENEIAANLNMPTRGGLVI